MATRYIRKGDEAVGGGATGNHAVFGVNSAGVLVTDRGTEHGAGVNEPIAVGRVIAASAATTLTPADNGALVVITGSASTIVSLPATQKGLKYTFVLGAVAGSGDGHAVSPAAADKIMGNGFTSADDKDAICSQATDREGDSITLEGDGSLGWYITAVTGTWARQA